MSDNVYKHIELTGTSATTMEDAVNNAVTTAGRSIRQMRWLEVLETRGHIEGDRVVQWQVSVKIGFTVED